VDVVVFEIGTYFLLYDLGCCHLGNLYSEAEERMMLETWSMYPGCERDFFDNESEDEELLAVQVSHQNCGPSTQCVWSSPTYRLCGEITTQSRRRNYSELFILVKDALLSESPNLTAIQYAVSLT
jgi:hypothetical protein